MPDVKSPIRCTGCNKILFSAIIKDGEIEIKCPNSKCGVMNKLTVTPTAKESSIVYDGVLKRLPAQ